MPPVFQYLPDSRLRRNTTPVYIEVRNAHDLNDARIALNTIPSNGEPLRFQRLVSEEGRTVVYRCEEHPWIKVGYSPPSSPANSAYDAGEIRRILGEQFLFIG